MIFYETHFTFEEVLDMTPDNDDLVRGAIANQTFDRWYREYPSDYSKVASVSYCTINAGNRGYWAVIHGRNLRISMQRRSDAQE